jgi:hypothetical protein
MSGAAELLAEINETVQRIDDKVQELQNSINSGLDKIPWGLGWIADRVREGWDWFVGKMNEFWDWLNNILSHMGDPDAISAAADAWSNDVGGPVSAEVGDAEAGSLLVDDNWTGDAAEQYKQRLTLQKTALDKIKSSFTDGISTALKDLRLAIWTFWAALVAALAALVVGIIGAVTSSATIFGLPAAPFIAAGAVGVCLAALWGGSSILKTQAANANTVLLQKLNDNAGFPDGHWPAATV